MSCSEQDFDALSTIDRREIPVIEPDVEANAERVGDVSVEAILPTESVNSEDTGNEEFMVKRFSLLQYAYDLSPRQACTYTAEKTLEGSRLSYEAQGGYVITQIEDIEIINDFRKTFPLPGPGEKIVVMQCNTLSRFDVEAVIYEGKMMIFLLVDDLGQLRARWEPDLTSVRRVS